MKTKGVIRKASNRYTSLDLCTHIKITAVSNNLILPLQFKTTEQKYIGASKIKSNKKKYCETFHLYSFTTK